MVNQFRPPPGLFPGIPNPLDELDDPVQKFINLVRQPDKYNSTTPDQMPPSRNSRADGSLERHIKEMNDKKLADPNYEGWVKQPDGSLEYRNPQPSFQQGMNKTEYNADRDIEWRQKFSQSDDERVQRLAKQGEVGSPEDPTAYVATLSAGDLQAPTKDLRAAYTVIKNKSGLNPSGAVWQEFLRQAPSVTRQWLNDAPPEQQNAQEYYRALTTTLNLMIQAEQTGGDPAAFATGTTTTDTESTTSTGSAGATTTASGAPNVVAITGVRSPETLRMQQTLNNQWANATDEEKAAITAEYAAMSDPATATETEVPAEDEKFDRKEGNWENAPLMKVWNAVFGR